MRRLPVAPVSLVALAIMVPSLPAVAQDPTPPAGGVAAEDGTGDVDATEPAGSETGSPQPTTGAEAPVAPTPDAVPADEPDAVPADEPDVERGAGGPDGADPTPPTTTDPVDAETRAVVDAAVRAAHDEAMLPVDDTFATTCSPEAIEVSWEPVPTDDFAVGGYVEPLEGPTDTPGDVATGIAVCEDSTHAVAGFDALLDADGTWDVHFVTPIPGPHGEAHDHESDEASSTDAGADHHGGVEAPDLSAATALRSTSAAASAAASTSVPDWPAGMPTTAEALSESDPQDTCDPTAKPGALALQDLLEQTYATPGGFGISRGCSVGGRSEHKEGRALDWVINAYDADEREAGDTFTDWVLSTDPWGNDFAGMRRLGIMYMIWNRQSIYSWNPEAGWRDYTGASDHTDHVHFSMTWPGARCQTSFWVATECSGDTPSSDPTPGPSGTDAEADYNVDGFSDILWYAPGAASDSAWRGRSNGFQMSIPLNVRGTYVPLQGDFNGDGPADVLWYGPGSAADTRWDGTAQGTFSTSRPLQVRGSYDPVVGDFDGDGFDDVFWYGPGSGKDRVWFGERNGFRSRTIQVRGVYEPVAGDFNGDGRDDVLWYGPGSAPDRLWQGTAKGGFVNASPTAISTSRTPVAGDFNADGRDDVFLYGAGSATDQLLSGRKNGTFGVSTTYQIQGSYRPFAGDFDGNGGDDLFWYGTGNGSDWVYYGGSSGFDPEAVSVGGNYQPISGG